MLSLPRCLPPPAAALAQFQIQIALLLFPCSCGRLSTYLSLCSPPPFCFPSLMLCRCFSLPHSALHRDILIRFLLPERSSDFLGDVGPAPAQLHCVCCHALYRPAARFTAIWRFVRHLHSSLVKLCSGVELLSLLPLRLYVTLMLRPLPRSHVLSLASSSLSAKGFTATLPFNFDTRLSLFSDYPASRSFRRCPGIAACSGSVAPNSWRVLVISHLAHRWSLFNFSPFLYGSFL